MVFITILHISAVCKGVSIMTNEIQYPMEICGVLNIRSSKYPTSTWYLSVHDEAEYAKLPVSDYPYTKHNPDRPSIAVVLYSDKYDKDCAASLHRDKHKNKDSTKPGHFYIASARRRLEDKDQTGYFNDFLRNALGINVGKDVETIEITLTFYANKRVKVTR